MRELALPIDVGGVRFMTQRKKRRFIVCLQACVWACSPISPKHYSLRISERPENKHYGGLRIDFRELLM